MLAQQEEMALKKEQEAEAIAKRTAMIEEARQMKVRNEMILLREITKGCDMTRISFIDAFYFYVMTCVCFFLSTIPLTPKFSSGRFHYN